jgi:hypothetical protein
MIPEAIYEYNAKTGEAIFRVGEKVFGPIRLKDWKQAATIREALEEAERVGFYRACKKVSDHALSLEARFL